MNSLRKKKIAIVGAGNAGCITASYLVSCHADSIDSIEIVYDSNVPIEEVGQGTTPPVSELLSELYSLDWHSHNRIDATIKTGVLYDGWNSSLRFHGFPGGQTSFHYSPHKLSSVVLRSGLFEVTDKSIVSLQDIDADFVFDCRGKQNKLDFSDECVSYSPLVNPLNHVLLGTLPDVDPKLNFTRCLATDNGWSFIIPNKDTTSIGYLYNSSLTDPDQASLDFFRLFGVRPRKGFAFSNYVANSIWVGSRGVLNGNRFSFLEPLEATSANLYLDIARAASDHIFNGAPKYEQSQAIQKHVHELEEFILWHYQFRVDRKTPFWEYAASIKYNYSDRFNNIFSLAVSQSASLLRRFSFVNFGHWSPIDFLHWTE